MHDVLAEHGEGGVVVRVVRARVLELLDQHLRRLVLDGGLVHDVLVLDRRAHRGIEDFLFYRGVHFQVLAHARDELAASLGLRAVHVLELLERLLHLGVVFLQEVDRVRTPRGATAVPEARMLRFGCKAYAAGKIYQRTRRAGPLASSR